MDDAADIARALSIFHDDINAIAGLPTSTRASTKIGFSR